MAKRMLVDATQPEETRVVVVNGNRLEDMDFEIASRKQLKGNIYLAKVTRVEPSLQAAFVEYGGNRHGFLAFAEIHPDYYRIPVADREALLAEERRLDEQADSASDANGSEISHVFASRSAETPVQSAEESVAVDSLSEAPAADAAQGDDASAENPDVVGGDEEDDEDAQQRRQRPLRSYKIQEVVKRRQVMLVQVTKEERGNKGAALTTYLSLPGRYCVLMPNTGRGGGISRKITNPADRKRLKEILSDLDIPEGMAVILRTAGLERSKQEIKRDLEYLLRLWDDIREQTLKSSAPCLIYEEANLIKRSIRDLYADDIDEIWIEGEAGFQTAKDFMRMLMPGHSKRVLQYRDETIPLFHRYQVETQIDAIHSPVVQLKSGGYIVINPTEALVSIDVNSGKSTRERNIEETAYKTNLEAADEVARQLRLRDLAGLIVIDFIDMEESRNNAAVERRMKEAMKNDRARIQLGRISAFGLLELSRQRLRPSLLETNFERCPHCSGTGVVRSVESAALHVLRAIEEEGIRKRAAEITTYVNSSIALYILNQKRTELTRIEERYRFKVMVQADDTLIPPELRVERIKARLPEDDAPLVSVDRAVAETDRVLAAQAEEVEEEIVEDVEAIEEVEAGESQAETAEGDSEGENERRRRRRRRRRGRNDRDTGDRSTQSAEDSAEDGAEDEGEAPAAVPAAQPVSVADAATDDFTSAEEDEDEDDDGEGDGEGEGLDANGDPTNGDRRKRRRGKRGGRRRNRQRELENGVENGDQPDDAQAGPVELAAPVQVVPLDDATLDAILTGDAVLTGEVPAAAETVRADTVSSEPVVEAAKPTRRRTTKKAETAPADAEVVAKPTRGRKPKAAEEVAKPTRRRTTKKVEADAAEVGADAVTEVAKPTRGRKPKKAEAETVAVEAVAEAEVAARPTRGRKPKAAAEPAAEAVTEVAKPARGRKPKATAEPAAEAEAVTTVAKPARGRKPKAAAPAAEAVTEAAKPTRGRKTKKVEADAVEAAPAADAVAPAVKPVEAEPAAAEKPKRGWWAR